MSNQDIEVTVGSTNIEATIEDDQVINITFASASSGQVLLTDLIDGASPVESPDGIRTDFTLPNGDKYISGRLKIYRDHAKLIREVDYIETSPTIFRLTVPTDSDEKLTMDYIRQ